VFYSERESLVSCGSELYPLKLHISIQCSKLLLTYVLTYLLTYLHCVMCIGAFCAVNDLSMNSKCYRKKTHNLVSWFVASNDCLSRGGSLAVFTDVGRPSDNSQLTDWLATDKTKTYWIGLVRSWWKSTDNSNLL